MSKTVFTLLLVLLTSCISGQNSSTTSNLNLDLERSAASGALPDGWFIWGSDFKLTTDTVVKHSGRQSVRIEPSGKYKTGTFGCLATSFPAVYKGSQIELRAWMKLENVSEGPVGLLLRIDGQSGILQFDNMQNKNISGTADWALYSVKLPNHPAAVRINIGGMLSGSGRLWVDDFEVLIDGVPLAKAEKVPEKIFGADADNEFDNGSGIGIPDINKRMIADLKLLGQVWGFLKYYHPEVAAGKLNWDYELFRIMPEVIAARDNTQRDDVLAKWIGSIGELKPGKEPEPGKVKEEVKMNPDLEWITGSGLSEALVAALENVRKAERTGKHYYIDLDKSVGNPVFTNEKSYSLMRYPDTGYRLLSLFRYWNIIQYWFPYKYLIGEDWNNVLEEFIPKFVMASDEKDYQLTTLGLITRVNDSHANISNRPANIDRFLGMLTPPCHLSYIGSKFLVTEIVEGIKIPETDLRKGDEIIKINGRPVREIVSERINVTPGSNEAAKMRLMARYLLRTNDTVMHLNILRDGVAHYLSVATVASGAVPAIAPASDSSFRMIAPGTGYLYLGSIRNADLPGIMQRLEGTKGLVIDLRCYPSEFVVFTLGSQLVEKTTPFVKFTFGNLKTPGLFTMGNALSVPVNKNGNYKGKIVILVNETTLSQAEYTAMAFRTAPGALVVGSQTAGADGNISPFTLPGGISTLITGIGVYYPDGGETQRVGIVPDIEVHPTVAGVRAGRDEVLEKAIGIITGENIPN